MTTPLSNNKPETQSSNVQRVKTLITRVGDQGPTFYRKNIEKLSEEIINNYPNESSENKELITKHFVETIGLLNQKGGIYATVITLIDLKLPNFAETIIDRVLENLQKGLDSGDLIVPKYSLIFLGELMNIGLVNSFSFITLLYDVVNEAEKTLKSSYDYYLNIVISVFPYLIDGLSEKSGLEFKSLIDNIQEIMKKRQNQHLCLMRHFPQKEYEDFLSLVWNHLFDILNKGGSGLKIINKPYTEFKEDFINIKQIKKNKKIYFNNKNQKVCVYFSPEKIPFLDEENVKEGNNNPNYLEKLLIFEQLSEIFMLFNKNLKILTQRLLHFPCTYSYAAILAEVLFAEVFKFPQPNSPIAFYSTLAVSLATESSEDFKSEFQIAFFQIIDGLFKKLETLDVSLIGRLINFLALFLGNKKAIWDWKKWDFVNEEMNKTLRKNFLCCLLKKLNFFLRRDIILEELPIEFHEFLPPEKLYKFKFNDPNSGNYADAEIIMDKLNSKVNEKELEEFLLKSDLNNLEASGDFFIEIFMECFLMKTSQSITHLKVIIERYKKFLSNLLAPTKETSQIIALNAIQEFWSLSDWHIILYIQTFVEYKLLKPSLVINWIFKNLDKTPNNFFEDWVYWDIIENIINRILSKNACLLDEQKRESKNEILSDIENMLKHSKEELKAIILLFFKKISLLLTECAQNNRTRYDEVLERLLSFFRKYRKEIEPLYEKIEEDFYLLANLPGMNKMIPYFKLLF